MHEPAPSLHAMQQAFTRYLRDPAAQAPSALDATRMGVYRRLIRGNLTGLLENAFPVCVTLLGLEAFDALVLQFLKAHRSQAPLFTELAAEFVQWLRDSTTLPHPALAELAHYEWVETALYQMDAHPLQPLSDAPLLEQPLQCSPLACALFYRWPVHQLGAGNPPDHPPAEPTTLLVRRDEQGQVRFSVLGALAAQLLHAIGARPGRTGATYLGELAQLHGLDPDALQDPFSTLLLQLNAQGVIGRPPTHPRSTGGLT